MESYKLYTDKVNTFECKIQLEGASAEKATVRVLLEGHGRKYLYSGKIDGAGACSVSIDKLNEIFDLGDSGTMQLEIIADDVYFSPWDSPFTIDSAKKVRVEVITPSSAPTKPSVVVNVKDHPATPPISERAEPVTKKKVNTKKAALDKETEFKMVVESIVARLTKNGISRSNIRTKKTDFSEILFEETTRCFHDHNSAQLMKTVVKHLV